MAEPRLRALVLAAGHGMRLRPLTDVIPKPLLPILGQPVIEQTLSALSTAGCEAVAINLHHLGQIIEERFGGAYHGMRLVYSHEPELLGTLGALGPLAEFAAEADLFLVVNGDSLCRWPLTKLVRRHLRTSASATLMCTNRPDPQSFGGGVIVRRDGTIRSLRGGEPGERDRRRVFAGAHVFDPAILERSTKQLGEVPADFVSDLYEPLMAEGETLQAFESRRHWHDLGTPERYLLGARNWGLGRWPRRFWRSNWLAPGATVSPEAHLRGSVVERGVVISPGCRIARSLILDGAVIAARTHLKNVVVGPNVMVPEDSTITGRMVTTLRSGLVPRAIDSVVGDLVCSRLEGSG